MQAEIPHQTNQGMLLIMHHAFSLIRPIKHIAISKYETPEILGFTAITGMGMTAKHCRIPKMS